MVEPKDKHQCEWRDQYGALEERHEALVSDFSSLKHEFEMMKRHLLGPKSEKMPSVASELKKGKPVDKDKTTRKRRECAQARKQALTRRTTVHPVPNDQRRCPACGNEQLKPVGEGKEPVVYEYLPAHFVAHRHLRETLVCKCGDHAITADGPTKRVEKSQYAPSFVAHVVTAKCADSIPLYRLEKELQRIGVPVARSTVTDLFHLASEQLAPLATRMVELMRTAKVVRADETSEKVIAE